jgi:hypothetical protein
MRTHWGDHGLSCSIAFVQRLHSTQSGLASKGCGSILVMLRKSRWCFWKSCIVLLFGRNLLANDQILLVAMRRQHDGYYGRIKDSV